MARLRENVAVVLSRIAKLNGLRDLGTLLWFQMEVLRPQWPSAFKKN